MRKNRGTSKCIRNAIIRLFFSIIGVVVFGICTITVISNETGFAIEDWILLLIFDTGSICLLIWGIYELCKLGKYYKYARALNGKERISFEDFAALVNEPKKTLKKKLKWMLQRDFFEGWYINSKRNEFVCRLSEEQRNGVTEKALESKLKAVKKGECCAFWQCFFAYVVLFLYGSSTIVACFDKSLVEQGDLELCLIIDAMGFVLLYFGCRRYFMIRNAKELFYVVSSLPSVSIAEVAGVFEQPEQETRNKLRWMIHHGFLEDTYMDYETNKLICRSIEVDENDFLQKKKAGAQKAIKVSRRVAMMQRIIGYVLLIFFGMNSLEEIIAPYLEKQSYLLSYIILAGIGLWGLYCGYKRLYMTNMAMEYFAFAMGKASLSFQEFFRCVNESEVKVIDALRWMIHKDIFENAYINDKEHLVIFEKIYLENFHMIENAKNIKKKAIKRCKWVGMLQYVVAAFLLFVFGLSLLEIIWNISLYRVIDMVYALLFVSLGGFSLYCGLKRYRLADEAKEYFNYTLGEPYVPIKVLADMQLQPEKKIKKKIRWMISKGIFRQAFINYMANIFWLKYRKENA